MADKEAVKRADREYRKAKGIPEPEMLAKIEPEFVASIIEKGIVPDARPKSLASRLKAALGLQ